MPSEEQIKNSTMCVFSSDKLGVCWVKLARMRREGEDEEGGQGEKEEGVQWGE